MATAMFYIGAMAVFSLVLFIGEAISNMFIW